MSIRRDARRDAVAAKRGTAMGHVANGRHLTAENDEPENLPARWTGLTASDLQLPAPGLPERSDSAILQRAIDQRRSGR